MTTFESQARARKATRLSEQLRALHVSAIDAALLDQPAQALLAEACGLRAPSTTTWTLTLGLLVQAEARDGDDVFAGLPGGTR